MNESIFKNQLPYQEIAIGWDRYNKFSSDWGFVAIVGESNREDLTELASDLAGGDNDAMYAEEKISELQQKGKIFMGVDMNPAVALQKAIDLFSESII